MTAYPYTKPADWEEYAKQIGLTEEMIEAGVGALTFYDSEQSDTEEFVAKVYVAMVKAKK